MEANEAGELQEHAEHGAHDASMRPKIAPLQIIGHSAKLS